MALEAVGEGLGRQGRGQAFRLARHVQRSDEIADEVDISPGNLHYHFRKKALIVDALLDEFRVDAARVLDPPPPELPGLEEGALRLWPHRHGTDGFFIARLRRRGEGVDRAGARPRSRGPTG